MNYATSSFYHSCFRDDRFTERWFRQVREGSNQVVALPFYGYEEPFQPVLSEWEDILELKCQSVPGLLDFEYDLAKKVGPMSTVPPLKDRMDDIASYYEAIHLPRQPIEDKAIEYVIDYWQLARGAQMRSELQTLENMKLSTFSGSPFCNKRRAVVNLSFPCRTWLSDGDGLCWQQLPSGIYGATAILGHRGQEGGPDLEDVKHRIVFMFPFSVNIEELRVYQVLIASAQRHGLQPGWISNDSVDERMTWMFDSRENDNDLVICTDFSKFDQHYNDVMQQASLDVLRGIFNNNREFQAWSEIVYPIKYNIPLAIDVEKVLIGPHGMGSGSGGTNADETLGHHCLQLELALKNDEFLNPFSQRMGDDGVLTFPGITVEKVVDSYTSHGQVCNPEKQYVSSDSAVYLRRYYHKDYRPDGIMRGIYSTCRALGRLKYMENWIQGWSKEAQVFRAFSIMNNLKYHPLREEFADFVIKGDKFRLGLDIPHFFENLDRRFQEVMFDTKGKILSWTQENMNAKEPMHDWWIVKYLESKL